LRRRPSKRRNGIGLARAKCAAAINRMLILNNPKKLENSPQSFAKA
jgi:hypothetical protein